MRECEEEKGTCQRESTVPIELTQSGFRSHLVGFGVLSGLVRQKDTLLTQEFKIVRFNKQFGFQSQ